MQKLPEEPLMFPVVIIEDRYGGAYAGGPWIAISGADYMDNGAYRIVRCLEGGPYGGDNDAQQFWNEPPGWIAAGGSPNDALSKLTAKFSAAKGGPGASAGSHSRITIERTVRDRSDPNKTSG
jgi:hypothetical protein